MIEIPAQARKEFRDLLNQFAADTAREHGGRVSVQEICDFGFQLLAATILQKQGAPLNEASISRFISENKTDLYGILACIAADKEISSEAAWEVAMKAMPVSGGAKPS